MEAWIGITLAAAFLQNVRSSLQKHLKGKMGTTGATFVRFGFGMPFVLALVAVLHWRVGYEFPALTPTFLVWMVIGGLGPNRRNFSFGSPLFVSQFRRWHCLFAHRTGAGGNSWSFDFGRTDFGRRCYGHRRVCRGCHADFSGTHIHCPCAPCLPPLRIKRP